MEGNVIFVISFLLKIIITQCFSVNFFEKRLEEFSLQTLEPGGGVRLKKHILLCVLLAFDPSEKSLIL